MAMVFLLVIIDIFDHFPMSHINMCMDLNHISKCIITLVTFKRSIGMSRPEMFSSSNKTCFSKGSFIYYVSTFFYQPQHFHEFFENFKLQHENFVKMYNSFMGSFLQFMYFLQILFVLFFCLIKSRANCQISQQCHL